MWNSVRLHRELRERGYTGGRTILTDDAIVRGTLDPMDVVERDALALEEAVARPNGPDLAHARVVAGQSPLEEVPLGRDGLRAAHEGLWPVGGGALFDRDAISQFRDAAK